MACTTSELWALRLQAEASDRAGEVAATAKFIRIFLQVAILGVGAYLVIQHEATAGVMIAASIVMGRAQFSARRVSLNGQLSILQKQITYLQRGIEGLTAQAKAKEEQIQSLKNEVKGYSELVAQGIIDKTRIWNIEREISRLSGEKAEHISDIDKSRASISEKELEISRLANLFGKMW